MKKKIVVLLVGPLPPPYGGIAAYVDGLANSEIENIEFEVFDTAFPSSIAPLYREGKMSYSSIIENGILVGLKMVFYVLWSYIKFVGAILKFRPDLIQVFPSSYWSYWRNLVYLLIAKLSGRRTIFHLLNPIDVFYRWVGPFQKSIIVASLNLADAYILQSPKLEEWVKQFSRRLVLGIWNGIDLTKVPAEGRYHCSAPSEVLTGVTVGKLCENKGTYLILSALETLKSQGVEVRWNFVGGGDIRSFRELTRQKGLEGQVNFTGPVDDFSRWEFLCQADFFCLPSFAEGQPISIIEAMSVGLPIISTRVGSIPEIVEDRINGLIINTGDPSGLVGAIRFLLQNPEIVFSMGQRSRRLSVERHNINDLFNSLSHIYRDMV